MDERRGALGISSMMEERPEQPKRKEKCDDDVGHDGAQGVVFLQAHGRQPHGLLQLRRLVNLALGISS